ncbi:hypothetical protein [Waddlia chondrophila]|uniref:Uncharacterized protein n=1 Tax=Waddlia chondrophila (strain ATCC VR-1470 / WSU 86-1044) TaxID=716544 RepID=D6YRR5_WADCW|nr:hypothetical protein [Waddlia chondrophila]ADI38760.1 hypothetical protein wcw_1410 [Waddlia chondrophila WSU 86-1044]
MVQFNNIQKALHHQIGQSGITVGDCLHVIGSNFLGRTITQLSLLFQGKGWVNEKQALQKIQSLDSISRQSIHSISGQIVLSLEDGYLKNRLNDDNPLRGDQKKISRKEEKQLLKDLELPTDQTIREIIKEMKLLSELTELKYEGW